MREVVKPGLFVVLLALVAALLLPGGFSDPDRASATHGRTCGVVAKGRFDYLVRAKKVSCGKGRKGAKRYLKKGKPLKGFKCKKNVGQYKFVCKNRTRRGVESYRAERL